MIDRQERKATFSPSVRHALVLLGEEPFRKWCALCAVTAIGADRPAELVRTSLVRSRFAERAGALAGLEQHQLGLFFVGLLSAIDALVGRPLDELLDALAVTSEVRQAILRDAGPLGRIHALVLCYERAQWDDVARAAVALGLDEAALPSLYEEALGWAAEIFRP